MTDKQQHPITPPPELVEQWRDQCHKSHEPFLIHIANCAAEWGYDQRGEVNEAKLQQARDEELEACCEWLGTQWLGARTEGFPAELRDARRPKPPNLKDLALSELETILNELHGANGSILTASAIRRALEALPDD